MAGVQRTRRRAEWDEGGEVRLVSEWEMRFKVDNIGGDGGTTPGDLRGPLNVLA